MPVSLTFSAATTFVSVLLLVSLHVLRFLQVLRFWDACDHSLFASQLNEPLLDEMRHLGLIEAAEFQHQALE